MVGVKRCSIERCLTGEASDKILEIILATRAKRKATSWLASGLSLSVDHQVIYLHLDLT